MVTFHSRKKQDAAFLRELARLSGLVRDMEAIGKGAAPEDLLDCEPPVLDRWFVGHRLANCLVGASTGHPMLPGDDRVIVTSDLCLLADDRRWARTRSRWYRLAQPAPAFGLDR